MTMTREENLARLQAELDGIIAEMGRPRVAPKMTRQEMIVWLRSGVDGLVAALGCSRAEAFASMYLPDWYFASTTTSRDIMRAAAIDPDYPIEPSVRP